MTATSLRVLLGRRSGLVGLLGGLALVLSACGSGSSPPAAASVNNQDVPLSAYQAQFKMDELAYADSTGYIPCGINGLEAICKQIKASALATVIGHEYVRQYAAKHGLSLTPAEVQRYWNVQFQAHFHGIQAAFNAWSKRTGIPESEFRASVQADQLQSLVLASVTQHVSAHAPALQLSRIVAANRKELKQVQNLLRNGFFDADAGLLTRTSKSGCSKTTCGSLGWIPYPLLPADGVPLEKAAVGTVVGPKLAGTFWDFLKVEGKDPHYKMTAKQLFLVKQKVFESWLASRIQHANVKRFVAV